MEIIKKQHTRNVGELERGASVLIGTAMLWKGIRTGRLPGVSLALGGLALVQRGVTGYCYTYGATGVNTARRPGDASIPYESGIRVDKSVTINRARAEVFAFWRNLENLPSFMQYLRSVTQYGSRRSHWVTQGVAGKSLEWDAEIINEVENELIGWRSLDGGSVDNAGSVRFEDAPGGRGTLVKVSLQYNPPGGAVGAFLAKLMGQDADQQVDSDLKRFKTMLEAGELPTSTGQPSGRTVVATQKNREERSEQIHAASEDSFPASDAPAWR